MTQNDRKYQILSVAPSLIESGLLKAIEGDPNYIVIQAHSASDALKIASSDPLDLILVDENPAIVSLPDLVAKAKGNNINIPILVFRDSVSITQDDRIWTLGIDDCILKPVRAVKFLHHIRRALHASRLGQDCENLRKENQQLYQLAITDSLTRLVNRRHFMERLNAEFARAKRFEGRLGYLICDIDHFKKVNDNYGHSVGDRVLKQVSTILASVIRSIDMAGRYGGEEFVLLLPETGRKGALFVAEKVRRTVEEFDFSPRDEDELPGPQHLTISIGAATFPESNVETTERLIEAADQALYRAKENGRNRVEAA